MYLNVKYLGQAGLHITTPGASFLLDPWCGSHPAFLETWLAWPNNSNETNKISATNVDFVWCSHAHDDHFDPYLLKRFAGTATFLQQDFPGENYGKMVAGIGFNSIESIAFNEIKSIDSQTSFAVLCEEPIYSEHALFVLKYNDTTLVHAGDSVLTGSHIDFIYESFGSIDFLFGQYCNPSPFPEILPQFHANSATKHLEGMDSFISQVKASKASYAIPFAGPALNREALSLNYEAALTEFPEYDVDSSYSYLRDKLAERCPMIPVPGAEIVVSRSETKFIQGPAPNWYDEFISYAARYGGGFEEDLLFSGEDLQEIGQIVLLGLSRYSKQTVSDTEVTLIFEVFGYSSAIVISLPDRSVSVIPMGELELNQSEYYKIRVKKSLLVKFANRNISFDDLSFSRLITIEQSPKGYDYRLVRALKAFHDPKLARFVDSILDGTNQFLEPTGFFEAKVGENAFLISDRCPHQGARLSPACVDDDGVSVTCPLHGWKFDLVTGQCLRGDSRAILQISIVEETD